MNNQEVKINAKKIHKRKVFIKIIKIVFVTLLIILSMLYLILYIVYDGGRFTVSLDKNLADQKSIYLSETGKFKERNRKLYAETINYMDNISIKWLPENIDTEKDGAHNGDNYIAYTFYTVNNGKESVDYWYEIDIDDTIRNVDEAIRIMIYRNGIPTVYAKKNKTTNNAEEGTKKFVSDKIAVLEQAKNLKAKTKDRFTIVVWIEGDDPDCLNDLLGGEIKMHMDITEVHKD